MKLGWDWADHTTHGRVELCCLPYEVAGSGGAVVSDCSFS